MQVHPLTFLRKSRSWKDIENDYVDFREGKEMLELIKHIINSGASERLFAYTSHYDLVVSIYDEINPLNESLRISYDFSNKNIEWLFEYYSGPSVEPEFEGHYPEGTLIKKFDGFLRKIAW